MACLDEPTVVAFVAGRLAGAAVETIDDHLADCQSCRDLVVWAAKTTLAIGSGRAEPEVAAPEPAPHAERYVIEELLGVGGQGLVYAATDTVLARTVALKVLRRQDDHILSEARLVARLNHPNIVAVYDAGTTRDGAVYLAMECVAETLATWRTGKAQREILRACIDAGRGLAAAHAAGIIHRDIKPSNVLIADGRARITDFGLALAAGDTNHGIAGTLAYMAPEQLDGVATAASDQFALAVAIWESLTEQLPFTGLDRLRAPGPSTLPRHVDTALRKAMAHDPADRFPEVGALIAALDAEPRRNKWILVGGALVAAGASVFAFASMREGPSCRFADSLPSWNEQARASLVRGFAALREPYAQQAGTAARDALDRYATTWIDQRTRACEQHESEAIYALRTQCLDERKAAFDTAVRTLSTPDAEVARHALEIVDGLPSLAPCDDTGWLAQRVRPPTDPAAVAKVAAIDTTLAESATTMRAGKIKPAIVLAERAVADATTLDHAPTRARAELALGDAWTHLPDNAKAEAALTRATQWAQHARDDRALAEAFIALVKVVGYGEGRWDEALRQADFAEATLVRLGDDAALRATLEFHRCAIYDQLARFAEAGKSCDAALAARRTAFGADSLAVADLLVLQARIATNQAKAPEAIALAKQALAMRERALGPKHPALVEALFALGHAEVRSGKLDDATLHFDRAMELAAPTFGSETSVAGSIWAERAAIASARGDSAAALEAIDRSTAIRERIGGPMHVDLVFNLITRGRILDDRGQIKEAAATLTRALDVAEHAFGKTHPAIAALLQDLGRVHAKLGDDAVARAELERAIAIAKTLGSRRIEAGGEAALAEMLHGKHDARAAVPLYKAALATYEELLGPDAPQLIPTLENLALAHLELREPALALPLLDRAITLERATTGENSPRLVTPLDSRGDAELALGDRAKAKATWTEALALPDVAKHFPEDTADVKAKLAKLR